MPKYKVIRGKVFKRYPNKGLVCHRAGTDTEVGEFTTDFYEANRHKLEPYEEPEPEVDDDPELPLVFNVDARGADTESIARLESKIKEMAPALEAAAKAATKPSPAYSLHPRGGAWFDVIEVNSGKRMNESALKQDKAEMLIASLEAQDGKD